MLEIPPAKKISESSAIIIEQQQIIRDALKSVLLESGVSRVVVCSNAFEALAAFRHRHFELVFVSFNLSTDKDGFHLLEELRFKGHINHSSIVVFLSADTEKGLVNSVVEMQPDDFWIKPFDLTGVKRRLEFMLNVKEVLHKPLYFADHQDYSRAIYYSDRLIALPELADYHTRLHRLKGQCLFALSEYKDAESLYRELTDKYKHNWVYIGLTKSLLKQNKYVEAQKLVNKLKRREDSRCAVHDLLAQHYVERGDYQQAYIEVNEAVKIAPRNIERNKRCWDLARLNHDRNGQLKATITMAKYARNSVHDSPEFILNVIRAQIDLANNLEELEAASILGQAQRKLNELKSNPKYYSLLNYAIDVTNARTLSARGDKNKAEKILEGVPKGDKSNLEYNLDLIKALHETGSREDCLALLEESKALADKHSFTGHILSKFIEQELNERSHIHFTPKELLEMSTAYHAQQKHTQAMTMLSQALCLSPKHIHVAMSILQVAVSIREEGELSFDHKRTVHTAIELLTKSSLAAEHKKDFAHYRSQIGEINDLDLVTTKLE